MKGSNENPWLYDVCVEYTYVVSWDMNSWVIWIECDYVEVCNVDSLWYELIRCEFMYYMNCLDYEIKSIDAYWIDRKRRGMEGPEYSGGE